LAVIAVDNQRNGGLDTAAMVPIGETKMRSLHVVGSIIGAALLCTLPVSPLILKDGGVSFAIGQAKAAELDADRPVHRKARRHVAVYAEGDVEDPRRIAYCTGNNGGGWNGGTYRGGIFMDLNCYGYAAGEPGYRGWGLGRAWGWWW
jgi:hypothetical protein